MSLKTFNFTSKIKSDLGIKTRTGSSKAIEIQQVDVEGVELEGVSIQEMRLTANGKSSSLLHKFAFHKNFESYGQSVKNEYSGEVRNREMPAPWKKVEAFDMPIDKLPEAIRDTETNGRMIDIEYVKTDIEGNITESVELIGDTYKKIQRDRPLYKEYFNAAGKPYVAEQVAEKEGDLYKRGGTDEAGTYKLEFEEYSHFFTMSIGLFNGVQLNDRGDAVSGTEGTYMVVGSRDDRNFAAGHARKTGVSFAIKSILPTVLGHPDFGVVPSDMTNTGTLPKGYFKVNTGTPVGIFDASGTIVAKYMGKGEDSRVGYKLSDFRPSKPRNAAKIEEATGVMEIKETETKETINNDLDF